MANFWLDERRDLVEEMAKFFETFKGQKLHAIHDMPALQVHQVKFWAAHPEWKKKYYHQTMMVYISSGTAIHKLVFNAGRQFQASLEL